VTEASDLTYEQALEEFDRRLRALEEGNLTLDQALETVNEARKYLLACEAKLEEAKGRLETRPAGSLPPPPPDLQPRPGGPAPDPVDDDQGEIPF
jgi:exodeoxyribonuclease VII small subunit